jgi:hypothetical protein
MPTEFKFDLNRITYKEITKFSSLPDKDQQGQSIVLMAKCLIAWPKDDAITAENIEALGMLDFAHLQRAFRAELDEAFGTAKN